MQDDEPTDVVLEQRALADEAMRPRDQRADGVRLAVASLLDMLGSCPHADERKLPVKCKSAREASGQLL
jgi:hypothetical protein